MDLLRRPFQRLLRVVALAAALGFVPRGADGAGFFDDVPKKGYIREDMALEALSLADQGTVLATIRYVRLVLDPGTRNIGDGFWPEREMLMVESPSGRIIFERVSKLQPPSRPDDWQPRGRVGLEGGVAIETFVRAVGSPADAGHDLPGVCATLDGLIRAGNVDLPLATADLTAPTVRLGIVQVVESSVGSRERDFIADTVPILLFAQSHGLNIGPLEVLQTMFPGRSFARSAQSLAIRVSGGRPLDPSEGSWRSVTQAPEMLQGVPLF